MTTLYQHNRSLLSIGPFVCVTVIGVLAFSIPVHAQHPSGSPLPKSQVSRSAAELFQRMHDQGAIDFDTAIGGYVVRIFNHLTEEANKAQLATVRKALEEAKEIRIANERTLGREVDEAALNAEIEANIAEMSEKLSRRGLQTLAVRYSQQGESNRIEQFVLPNDVTLDSLRDDLKNGKIPFSPTYIRTWNGKLYAEILRTGSSSTLGDVDLNKSRQPAEARAFAALSYENRTAGVVKFTTYARDGAVDPGLLEMMAEQGFPSTVVTSRTEEGDEALVLKVGSPESVSLYLEVTVLPTKGYCIKSALTKVQGAVMARDEFRNFVQTSAGFWLPMRITREAYKLDMNQVPYLSSKEELLAFEQPKTNVTLASAVFDLSNSNEFKALPLSTHLLPQGSPYIKNPGIDVTDAVSNRMLGIIVTLLIIAGLAGLWFYRRLARSQR